MKTREEKNVMRRDEEVKMHHRSNHNEKDHPPTTDDAQ